MAELREIWYNTAQEIADWCRGALVEEVDALDPSKRYLAVNVPTPDGVKRASQGDTVIQFEDGSFDVF